MASLPSKDAPSSVLSAAIRRRPNGRHQQSDHTHLSWAIQALDVAAVRELLSLPGINPNKPGPNGNPPLAMVLNWLVPSRSSLWAQALKEDPEKEVAALTILNLLLVSGASPNAPSAKNGFPLFELTPLQQAYANPTVCDRLLQAGADPGKGRQHPLLRALALGPASAVAYWWERRPVRPDPDFAPWAALLPNLTNARQWGKFPSLRAGWPTLFWVDSSEAWSAAQALVDAYGADEALKEAVIGSSYAKINEEHQDTPLVWACRHRLIPLMSFLLKNGVNPRLQAANGCTPLGEWLGDGMPAEFLGTAQSRRFIKKMFDPTIESDMFSRQRLVLSPTGRSRCAGSVLVGLCGSAHDRLRALAWSCFDAMVKHGLACSPPAAPGGFSDVWRSSVDDTLSSWAHISGRYLADRRIGVLYDGADRLAALPGWKESQQHPSLWHTSLAARLLLGCPEALTEDLFQAWEKAGVVWTGRVTMRGPFPDFHEGDSGLELLARANPVPVDAMRSLLERGVPIRFPQSPPARDGVLVSAVELLLENPNRSGVKEALDLFDAFGLNLNATSSRPSSGGCWVDWVATQEKKTDLDVEAGLTLLRDRGVVPLQETHLRPREAAFWLKLHLASAPPAPRRPRL